MINLKWKSYENDINDENNAKCELYYFIWSLRIFSSYLHDENVQIFKFGTSICILKLETINYKFQSLLHEAPITW